MRVAIVGCGGITNYLYDWLVRYLISREESSDLFLIDGDDIESSNTSRQWFRDAIGRNKAEVAKETIDNKLKAPNLTVHALPSYINSKTIDTHRAVWLKEGIVVLACVDNNGTRVFLEDLVSKFRNAALICGGNDESSGQAQIYLRRDNRSCSPKITDCSPEIKLNSDIIPGEGRCLESSGGQTAMANWATALAMGVMLQRIEDPEVKKIRENEITVDLTRGRMTAFRRPSLKKKRRRKACTGRSPSRGKKTTTSRSTRTSPSTSKKTKSSPSVESETVSPTASTSTAT